MWSRQIIYGYYILGVLEHFLNLIVTGTLPPLWSGFKLAGSSCGEGTAHLWMNFSCACCFVDLLQTWINSSHQRQYLVHVLDLIGLIFYCIAWFTHRECACTTERCCQIYFRCLSSSRQLIWGLAWVQRCRRSQICFPTRWGGYQIVCPFRWTKTTASYHTKSGIDGSLCHVYGQLCCLKLYYKRYVMLFIKTYVHIKPVIFFSGHSSCLWLDFCCCKFHKVHHLIYCHMRE